MEQKCVLVHVGRLHYKLTLKSVDSVPEAMELYDLKHKYGFAYALATLQSMMKQPNWTKKSTIESILAIQNLDYVIEIGDQNTPLVPLNWHLRFGDKSPLKDREIFTSKIDDLTNSIILTPTGRSVVDNPTGEFKPDCDINSALKH